METDDVKINNLYGNFKFRVNGILIQNNEILVVKINPNSFYCLPGGHVKIGEDSQNAIIREMKEETGYDTHIIKLISVTENFFIRKNNKKIHELGFYYLLKLNSENEIKEKEYDMLEENEEENTLHFKWIPINKLKNIDFKPIEVKEKIENRDNNFEHLIIK